MHNMTKSENSCHVRGIVFNNRAKSERNWGGGCKLFFRVSRIICYNSGD